MSSIHSFVDSVEIWASRSFYLRAFGAPFLVAAAILTLGLLFVQLETVGRIFAHGIIVGIVLSVANTITGRPRIRLAMQMAYMVCFYGSLMVLPFIVRT
ncbi:MAG: hypothetical protein K8F91_16730 [Candidatus Obscuribacterales bacterium]|nr:hypothetical protein [Candidatus Obscuribacterales bacterium]